MYMYMHAHILTGTHVLPCDPLSLLGYPMIIYTHPIVDNLPMKLW
jgi:hypothetical protein